MNFIGIFLFSFKDNNSLDSNEYGRIRMRMVSMCPIHCSLTWLFVGGSSSSSSSSSKGATLFVRSVCCKHVVVYVCVGFASVPISFGFRFYLFGFIVLQSLVSGR